MPADLPFYAVSMGLEEQMMDGELAGQHYLNVCSKEVGVESAPIYLKSI